MFVSKTKFGILYQNIFSEKKNRQNGVERLSAFCQILIFGIMSVHHFTYGVRKDQNVKSLICLTFNVLFNILIFVVLIAFLMFWSFQFLTFWLPFQCSELFQLLMFCQSLFWPPTQLSLYKKLKRVWNEHSYENIFLLNSVLQHDKKLLITVTLALHLIPKLAGSWGYFQVFILSFKFFFY